MELRALRYFVEVVRQQSFTAAAEQMFVTQPTISKMVKALEDEIGTPLLLRDSRQMVLTDAGRIVFQRGQDVLAAQAQLQAELDDLAELGRGELTIGIPPLGGAAFTPAIAAFRQRYPNIELKLFEQGARMIEAALASGELELGGVLEPVDPAVFEVLRMVRAPLWLVARRGSRWDQEDTVPLADLAEEPFVFYAEGAGAAPGRARRLRAGRLHALDREPQRPLGLHGRAGPCRSGHRAAAGAVLPPARSGALQLPADRRARDRLVDRGGLEAARLPLACGTGLAGGGA